MSRSKSPTTAGVRAAAAQHQSAQMYHGAGMGPVIYHGIKKGVKHIKTKLDERRARKRQEEQDGIEQGKGKEQKEKEKDRKRDKLKATLGSLLYRSPKGSPYGSHEGKSSDRPGSEDMLPLRKIYRHDGQDHASPGLPHHHQHHHLGINDTHANDLRRNRTGLKNPYDDRTDSAILHNPPRVPEEPHYTF